jgi:Tol biopolymer transport system component
VAFSWGQGKPDASHDIWIKAVEGDVLHNLTNTPDVLEKFPKWSPDGQFIAFTRYVKGNGSIFKVSALGGAEVMLAEAAAEADWLPDGRSLVAVSRTPAGHSGLIHHVLDTGARRWLTEAESSFVDAHPAVSPDGTTIAFTRLAGNRSAVFLVALSGGEPRRLGEWYSGIVGGLEWTPNGREIVLARPENSGRRLVRQPIAANDPALAVLDIPHNSIAPSFSGPRSGNTHRLAFVSGLVDVGLRLVDLHAPQQEGTIVAHSPFCDAARMDSPGRFSPDGSQVAFVSDRSGSQQIWVANRNGSGLRSVTSLRDASVSLGSWSPDGRVLTYDATIGETTHIYVVPLNGGPATRLTQSASGEIDPEWSRDGRWIYFSSNQSGRWSIWRVPATGGTSRQLASELGFDPRESPDGRSVFFIDRPRYFGLGSATSLKRVSVDGGPVETLDVQVMPGAWSVTDDGIAFISIPGLGGAIDFARPPDELKMFHVADRSLRTLGTFGFRVGPYGASRFLTVSRDGLWAIASHVDRWDRDIYVIDKFR